ncbi:MAG: DNA polymerase I, partial [Oscillospiraceae bacterium]
MNNKDIIKLLAVDGNSLLNRAYYGVRMLTTKDGIYTNAIYGFLNILTKIIGEINPTHYAICFDVSKKTFRNDQYSQYKGTRKGMPDELRSQMPILKELLKYLGYPILGKEGFEADDLLGTLANFCTKNNAQCVIATGDRDSFQLINNNVSVRLASTKQGQAVAQLIDLQYIKENYGFDDPKKLIEVKAIMGDASDNIPGVAGIGEKGALKLICEFENLENVYENLESKSITPANRKKLEDSKDIAFLSKTLATIKCDVEIEEDFCYYEKKENDNKSASNLLAKLEMFSMFDRLDIPRDLSNSNENKNSQTILKTIELNKLSPIEFLNEIKSDEIITIYSDDFSSFLFLSSKNYTDCSGLELSITKKILEKENQKYTFKSKELFLFAFKNKIELSNICEDGVLISYLLNPALSEYDIINLSATYSLNLPEEDLLIQKLYATYEICEKIKDEILEKGLERVYRNIELPLAKVLASMEYEGFLIDKKQIFDYSRVLTDEILSLEEQIYTMCDEKFNINSPKQLGVILFEKLKLPVIKKTKTGYSTNSDVLQELRKYHGVIDLIIEYRQLSKLNSTYTTAFIDLADENDKIHTTFIQTETKTGRISSVNPNMQNIPVRTQRGKELRKFFKAPEGKTLVDADYSQIELRVLSCIASDKKMMDAFKNDEDIHTQTACEVFNMPPDFITDVMRRRAKAVNFGIVYGIGAFSLSQDIDVSVKQAKEYINNYLQTYCGVAQFMENAKQSATETGYSETFFGRRRYIPELRATNKIQKAFGERIAMNSPIQGTAADIIKIAMIKV